MRGRWVVSNEPGPDVDSTSIAEIVARASSGDLVLIRPGLYIGHLELLRKSLTLRGLGSRPEEVMLTSPDSTAVMTAHWSTARLENLMIQPSREASLTAAAISVWSSKITLKNVVASSLGPAIESAQGDDSGTALSISSSKLNGSYADILVRGTARVALTDDDFSNERQPIVVWRDAHVTVKSCRFHAGPAARIYAYSDSSVDVEDSRTAPPLASERERADISADQDHFLPKCLAREYSWKYRFCHY
jgi:hypothetical protein